MIPRNLPIYLEYYHEIFALDPYKDDYVKWPDGPESACIICQEAICELMGWPKKTPLAGITVNVVPFKGSRKVTLMGDEEWVASKDFYYQRGTIKQRLDLFFNSNVRTYYVKGVKKDA